MKEIVIGIRFQRKEIRILITCFILAFLLNVVSIILYKTPWHETVSQIGYVLAITIALYLVIAGVRLTIFLIKRLYKWIYSQIAA